MENKLYIDSIRGVAILMVIGVHAALASPVQLIPSLLCAYGQMGVQLFFVASAFTLCLSASNRSSEPLPKTSYAIRRLFRIAPLYYLGILGYWLLHFTVPGNNIIWLSHTDEYTWENVLANLTFVHGFVPTANNNIVPGGWSIGTEMAFYAMFPLLFTLTSKAHIRGIISVALAVATATAMAYGINKIIFLSDGGTVMNNTFLYYNLYNQLPVFIAGMTYYSFHQSGNTIAPRISAPLFIGLTAIAITLWHYQISGSTFVFIPAISAFSFIFLIEWFRGIPRLNSAFLQTIGKASYSMYLVHFLILHMLREWDVFYFIRSYSKDAAFILTFILTTLISLSLASLSLRCIERPSIRIGKLCISLMAQKFVNRKQDSGHCGSPAVSERNN